MSVEEILTTLEKNEFLNHQHYPLILTKTNRIHEDMLLSLKRAQDSSNQYYGDSISEDIPRISKSIFEKSISNFAESVSSASQTDFIACLSVLGKTRVQFEMDPIACQKLETRALSEEYNFKLIDYVTIVPYLYNIGYTAYHILAKINEAESFVTVNNILLKDFLNCLIKIEFTQNPTIYVKIFEQFRLASSGMQANEVSDIIEKIVVLKDKKILDLNLEVRDKFNSEITKYFFNKLNDIQKRRADNFGVSKRKFKFFILDFS